jgi:hypothetical protein
LNNLKTVQATKVLQLKNYAVYRIDRATTMAVLADAVPTVSHIDFASVNAARHQLAGWSVPRIFDDGTIANTIWEMERCPMKHCRTILTKLGVRIPEVETRPMGQLMIRSDAVCDLRVTFAFAKPSYVQFSINGFTAGPLVGTTATFTVPVGYLTKGVDIVEIENMLPRLMATQLHVSSVDLTPACTAP